MRVTIDTTRGIVTNSEGDSYIYGLTGRKPKWVKKMEAGAISAKQAADLKKIKPAAKVRLTGSMTCPETGAVHTFGSRGRPPLWVKALLEAGVRPTPATEAPAVAEEPAAEA